MNNIQDNMANDLIQDLLKEKRSDRLWKNIRFFITLALFVIVMCIIFSETNEPPTVGTGSGYVALVRLNGMIESGGDFSSETVLPVLRDAFADKGAKGVVLDINSGGGSPVQSAIIHDAIIELKNKYHKPVIVVGEDMLASGAYYVAVGADKIFVNPNSVTGSIGVIMKGFGFTDFLKKAGVDRRVYTAGTNKDRLDPFLPQNKADIAKIQQVIGEIHNNFMKVVLEGRKGKLHADPKELFSGDFWSGPTAVKLGLVDGLGNLSDVMRSEFKVSRYKDYTQGGNVFKSLATQIGGALDLPIGSRNDVEVLEKI